ncbi:MAG: hypothetical protein GY947_19675 [Rhodobacteraceae bacterium]|nr:hypothetical protein [Paracoccaceae bacterium]
MSDKKNDQTDVSEKAEIEDSEQPESAEESAQVDMADEEVEETTDDASQEDATEPTKGDVEHHADHEGHEEHGPSLSARVLRGLFLIAIGCTIALWGAPKLAPLLPQGLAPVAAFLMPGQTEAKAEIAALKSELDNRIAALESRPAEGISRSAIDDAITAYDAKIKKTLSDLKDQIGATDGQAVESRLAQLETRLEGATAELAAVGERFSMQITENGAALSEEAASKLAGYQAVIEGLKAQVDDLAAKNGSLSQKIDDVSAASTRRVQEAEEQASAKVTSTATKKLISDIAVALDSGKAFQPALDGLAKIAAIEPPAALADVAPTGTTSWAALRGQFSEIAHAAIRADTKASAGDGVVGKFSAFLKTQVGTRSLERKEGDSTDAVLSRVEDELIRGNLGAALNEANTLTEPPKAAMSDWLSALSRLAAAQSALAQLTGTLDATN